DEVRPDGLAALPHARPGEGPAAPPPAGLEDDGVGEPGPLRSVGGSSARRGAGQGEQTTGTVTAMGTGTGTTSGACPPRNGWEA
ncbi:hypothetical protein, partial [Actinoplanes italicus]